MAKALSITGRVNSKKSRPYQGMGLSDNSFPQSLSLLHVVGLQAVEVNTISKLNKSQCQNWLIGIKGRAARCVITVGHRHHHPSVKVNTTGPCSLSVFAIWRGGAACRRATDRRRRPKKMSPARRLCSADQPSPRWLPHRLVLSGLRRRAAGSPPSVEVPGAAPSAASPQRRASGAGRREAA